MVPLPPVVLTGLSGVQAAWVGSALKVFSHFVCAAVRACSRFSRACSAAARSAVILVRPAGGTLMLGVKPLLPRSGTWLKKAMNW